MRSTPEPVVGQTPRSGLRWAPVPGETPLRNVVGMGDMASDQPFQHGAPEARPSATTGFNLAGRTAKALAAWPRAVASAQTWSASANLVVSLVIGGVFAAATVVALVVSLATVWIVGVGVTIRAGAFRLSARFARLDRERIERLSGPESNP